MSQDDKKPSSINWIRFPSTRVHQFKRLYFWMLLYPLIIVMVPATAAATDHAATVNCDVHHGACSQTVSGVEVTFDISPKPVKAMTDLKFTITLEGEQPKTPPYIDLGMPGMNMGPNRVSLQATEGGSYEGVGIIVRCPSGKRIWRAKITLPDLGEAEFVFDVIY